ncbi:di-trans,poly-cis-decaprenylcistransferase [Streptomyces cellostaticus]|uniref:Isoprenyl transferase n=1 Tax=Streptomyces cellostaticus TaxID=67285 RepID=A0A101N540_9ACTN|nr:polyprenyl diphosphate synthase [Streptomyces cellostaticus]KUM86684.1 di-trans,poly-cis-decaprenylcistransferase [Streptomyces cellostaticus]GHI10085.1 isoprenyl transferase [Streptomyces cellostaticus]
MTERGALGVPAHVACIMDGNGRWAQQRGLRRIDGHSAGEASIRAIIDAARGAGIQWLTLFAFSTENWDRPVAEVDHLMEFLRRVIRRRGRDLHQRGVRVRVLGRADPRIPDDVHRAIDEIEQRTRANTRMTLTFAFDHGGRQEIVDGVRRLVRRGMPDDAITEAVLADHLQYPDMPDVDLLIRTSGEYRISNFLLWHIAYAELVFLDVLWPDFRARHLHEAIDIYRHRSRRFGSVGAQQVTEESR